MDLPKPKWFTCKELAGYWECEQSLVERYIQTGQLAESARFTRKDNPDEWVKLPYTGYCAWIANYLDSFKRALSEPIKFPVDSAWAKNNSLIEDKEIAEEFAGIVQSNNDSDESGTLPDYFMPKDFNRLVELMYNQYGFEFDQNYIKLEDVEAFEREHATPPEQREAPPDESPLTTQKAIAKQCGVTAKRVRDWETEYKDFPYSQEGGKHSALPTKLGAWMKKHKLGKFRKSINKK